MHDTLISIHCRQYAFQSSVVRSDKSKRIDSEIEEGDNLSQIHITKKAFSKSKNKMFKTDERLYHSDILHQ